MTGPKDIHDYLAAFEDIPGTRVFTAARARAGYHLNQFAMSLMKPQNRERWKTDETGYLADWPLSDDQREAILARDYNRLLDLGGNIYFLAKIVSTDGLSFVHNALVGIGVRERVKIGASGKITARVQGSNLYTIGIEIAPLSKAHWARFKTASAFPFGNP